MKELETLHSCFSPRLALPEMNTLQSGDLDRKHAGKYPEKEKKKKKKEKTLLAYGFGVHGAQIYLNCPTARRGLEDPGAVASSLVPIFLLSSFLRVLTNSLHHASRGQHLLHHGRRRYWRRSVRFRYLVHVGHHRYYSLQVLF